MYGKLPLKLWIMAEPPPRLPLWKQFIKRLLFLGELPSVDQSVLLGNMSEICRKYVGINRIDLMLSEDVNSF